MTVTKSLVFLCNGIEIREQEFSIVKNGELLSVEPRAFRLLIYLLRNPQRVITKEELLRSVWDDATVTENSLARAILKLRQCLGDNAKSPLYIETVSRIGYRFLRSVEVVESPGAVETSPDLLPTVPPTGRVSMAPNRKAASNLWEIDVAMVIAIMALTSAYIYLSRPFPPPRVSGFTPITRDGRTKELRGSDGSRLYFTQLSPNKIAQVSVNGGEIAEVPVTVPKVGCDVALKDVSRDGSNMLIALIGSEEDKQTADSLWIAPILGGPAKRLDAGVSGDFSPDGSEVIYSTDEGDIYLSRTDGTEKRRLAKVGRRAYWFRWSQDGKTIRFTRNDGSLWEMNSDGSRMHQLLTDRTEQGFLCCGEWTPDGDFYLFHSYNSATESDLWAVDERHRLFRPRTSGPIRLTTGPIQWGASILSWDGKSIFAEGITPRGELSRIDPRTGTPQPFLDGISAEFVSFSPNGKSVAYVLFPEGTLWKANLDGSDRVQLSATPNNAYNPRWSPDSKRVLFSTDTIGRRHSATYLVPAEGGIPRKLVPGEGVDVDDASWSPDGNRVVFDWGGLAAKPEERDLRIIDLESGQIQTIPGSDGFWSVRWSSDGRYLAAFAYPSRPNLRIFDFKSKKWTAVEVNGEIAFPSFSHDGLYIYFVRPGRNQGVFRVPVTGGKEERVVNMTDWHLTGYLGYSMSLDPTDAPLVLRDMGSDDIYALTFDRSSPPL